MRLLVFVGAATVLIVLAVAGSDPASDQLPNFKKNSKHPVGLLTTSNGAPVEITDTSTIESYNLINNDFFMETLSHRVHENIPDRIFHTKGAGAFGYFQVTHNISDICRANLFNTDGKKTPVVVRFSPGNAHKGEPDTLIDVRGFAVKFYTDEGNFDIVGLNTPIFVTKDPQLFLSISKSSERNPVTNMKDPNMMWDLISLKPEVLPMFLYIFGDNGIPNGYRFMPGFSIHTYQVYNKCGDSYFVRFHFYPDGGIQNIYLKEAGRIGCENPDYATQDLYNAIERGEYPTWTVKVQVLNSEDIKTCDFDPFDVTKILSEDIYPLRTLGKLVLNRNPTNYFADVEQTAFCPGNLVRGILGAPDMIFQARRFAYKAAQRYRLGSNFYNIPVNKARNKVRTMDRDGSPPVDSNGGSAPNYYPSSFLSPMPYVDKNKPKFIRIQQYDDSYNFEQTVDRYNKLTNDEKQRLVENIVSSLHLVIKSVQERVIALFKSFHRVFALKIIAALTKKKHDPEEMI